MSLPTSRAAAGGALALVAMAAVLAWAALTRASGLNVPPSIALVLAAGLVAAAMALLARAAGRARMNTGLIALVFLAFATTGAWIGLVGAGAGCTAVVAGRPMPAGARECRLAFGGGSVLTFAFALLAARMWWRGRRVPDAPDAGDAGRRGAA